MKIVKGMLIALLSAAALAQNAVNPGTISGMIVDEAGRPILSGKLLYMKLSEYTRDTDGRMVVKEFGFTKTVAAGADGKFTVSGLPAGRYHLCGQGVQPNQVSDCTWLGVPVIDLAAGQTIANVTRKVLNGTVLTLQIDDPNGRIAVPDSRGNVAPARRFFVGVSAGTYYRRAERISTTATQHVFQVVIPKQQAVHLFIDSDLTVTDAAGRALETKRPTALEIAPGLLDQLLFAAKII